jgi:hypothetical protein
MGAITFAGKTYHSVDDMPTDVRQAYEQVMAALANTNPCGVPDAWEMGPQIMDFQPQQSAQNDTGKPKELQETCEPGCSTAEEEPSEPEESISEP